MRIKSKLGMILLSIFSLLVLLLNQPFLSIPKGQIDGIPSLLIYLLAVWISITAVMALISKRTEDQ